MGIRTAVVAWMALAGVAAAADGEPATGWRRDGSGRFPEARPPLTWSAVEQVVWKTPLAKPSNASPIVVGDRLFVCVEPSTLVCVSTVDGRVLWEGTNEYIDLLSAEAVETHKVKQAQAKEVKRKIQEAEAPLGKLNRDLKESPEDAGLKAQIEEIKTKVAPLKEELKPLAGFLDPETHPVNGYTSSTPASDGKRVYVLFGSGVAACYDLEGQRVWARLVEKPTHGWGHSASPLIVGDTLLVHIQSLIAVDAGSGETRWQIACPLRWGSPVAALAGGVPVVVTAGGDIVRVDDGRALARNLCPLEFCAPIVHDGVAYFIQNGGKAFRLPDDAENAGAPAPLWQTLPPKERYYASPVIHEGLIYAVQQKGTLSVIEAATGQLVYSKDLDLGKGTVYPSVTLAGEHVFVSSDSGVTLVLKPGREYQEVARNTLEPFRSSPLFVGDRLYVRAFSHLYCIGAPHE